MPAATGPATSFASQSGTRRGGLARIAAASAGTQSRAGAGSSSVTWKIPGAPRSSASTVAAAASSTWTNENRPEPSPTTGKRRRRTSSAKWPPGA